MHLYNLVHTFIYIRLIGKWRQQRKGEYCMSGGKSYVQQYWLFPNMGEMQPMFEPN